MKNKIIIFLGAVLLIFFTSCKTELEKYYETPSWLKGNSWQVLETKGDFKLFLTAVEKSSFKDLVQGKGLITVMAPTDKAFEKYLADKGYTSVSDISLEELDKLIGYHLVYYSFTKEGFEDYKPMGIESKNLMPGTYYKFRTKSKDAISTMLDPATGTNKKVVHKERFLPVYSYNLFESYILDAKANYEFFYPTSTWTGDDGFNVSNASVDEYALVTDNGYVYVINQVLDPLETIYEELKKSSEYETFANAYDRFVNLIYSEEETFNYGSEDSLHFQIYSDLPPIATEWTLPTPLMANDFAQLAYLSSVSYNLFAPNNAAMAGFFNQYWASYYDKIEDVNFLPMLVLLLNHTYNGSMLFPQQIESGEFKTDLGSTILINREDVHFSKMCVNGSVYGFTNVFVPTMFEKVSRPMMCDPKYNMFLDMALNSRYLMELTSDNIQFKVFYPSDSMLINNTTLQGRTLSYVNTNPKLYGAQAVQIEGDDGPVNMNLSQKTTIAGSHIATSLITSRGEESIYKTRNDYNYLYVKGDSVFSSMLYNKTDRLSVPLMRKMDTAYSNGEAYELLGENASALVPEPNQFKSIISSNFYPEEFTYFKALLDASGIDKTTPPFNFLQGERYIVLVPSDPAILQGIMDNKIPMSPSTEVAKFLKNYFIRVNESNLLDYPFSGTGVSKDLISFGVNAAGDPVKFKLSDDGTNLIVTDAKGNEVKILSFFPKIYADGAAYLLDGILETEE